MIYSICISILFIDTIDNLLIQYMIRHRNYIHYILKNVEKFMQLWPFSFSFMSIYFCMNMHIEANTAHNSRQTAHLHVLHNDAGKTVKICVYLLYKQLLSSIKEAGLEIPYYSILFN